jgi:hypothetical protein
LHKPLKKKSLKKLSSYFCGTICVMQSTPITQQTTEDIFVRNLSLLLLHWVGLSAYIWAQDATPASDIFIKVVSVENKNAKITWIVQPGHRSRKFRVEKSTNGQDFDVIADTPAKFDASNPQMFVYIDEEYNRKQTAYYRIADQKPDKQVLYSPVVKLDQQSAVENADGLQIVLEDTPKNSYVVATGTLTFTGRPFVFLAKDDSEAGFPAEYEQISDTAFRLKMNSTLAPGNYEIRVRDNAGARRFRFVVKENPQAVLR